jgi:hypothetical protein
MSDSRIQAIYLALSKMRVGSVGCRNITEVKLEIRDKDLPCRFLLPSTEGDLNFVALGSSPMQIQWVIRDLLLWAPMTKGKGIEQYSSAMLDYEMLYIKRLQENMNPTNQSVITNINWRQAPIPWGPKDYWGIDFTLTVQEIA